MNNGTRALLAKFEGKVEGEQARIWGHNTVSETQFLGLRGLNLSLWDQDLGLWGQDLSRWGQDLGLRGQNLGTRG